MIFLFSNSFIKKLVLMKKLYFFSGFIFAFCFLNAQMWTNVSAQYGISDVVSVVEYPGQGTLVATKSGIYKYSNGLFFAFNVANATDINKLQHFNGKLYVSTDNGLYIWCQQTGTEHLDFSAGLMSNHVYGSFSFGNKLWILQKDYLTLRDGTTFFHYHFPDMFQNDLDNNFNKRGVGLIDNYGIFYFSYKNKLMKFQNNILDTLHVFADPINDIVLNTQTNQVFIATERDIFLKQSNQYHHLFSIPATNNGKINFIRHIPAFQQLLISVSIASHYSVFLLYDINYQEYKYGGYINSKHFDVYISNSIIHISAEKGLFVNDIQIFDAIFSEDLEGVNFRAKFTASGNLFWEGIIQEYFGQKLHLNFPKDEDKITVFAASIWLGGFNQYNTLCLAAERFLQEGKDFNSGPVSNVYNNQYDEKYSRLWKLNSTDITNHAANYNMSGYQMLYNIQNWPAHGNVQYGEAPYLAPFFDANQNGIYDPQNGDFPIIPGKQAIYMIFSDDRYINTESGGQKTGVEVHAIAYVVDIHNDTVFNDVLFLKYNLFNRRNNDFSQFYIGHWSDIDIGYAFDDFIGCDTSLHCFYGYNGDNYDGNISNPSGEHYGYAPPVQGITFLNNNMSSFNFHNNMGGSFQIDPQNVFEYYNLLQGLKIDGSPYINPLNGQITKFSLPGNPMDSNQWSDITSGNGPYDRRGLGTTGPMNFNSGSSFCWDIAYVYNRDCTDSLMCDNLSNIQGFLNKTAHVRNVFNTTGYQCPMSNTVFTVNQIPEDVPFKIVDAYIYNSQINYSQPIDYAEIVFADRYGNNRVITNWKIYQGSSVIDVNDVVFDVDRTSKAMFLLNLNHNPNEEIMESYTIKLYSDGLTHMIENQIFFVSISPNPANDILLVNFNEKQILPVELSIMNLSGSIVFTYILDKKSNQLDIANVSQGMYFIRIIDKEGNTQTVKLIKQ